MDDGGEGIHSVILWEGIGTKRSEKNVLPFLSITTTTVCSPHDYGGGVVVSVFCCRVVSLRFFASWRRLV